MVASIKKNKKGLWEVRYDAGFNGEGKRIQKFKGGFEKKEDAERYLTDMLYGINHGMYIEPKKMFLYQYMNNWLKNVEFSLSPTTYDGYEVNIRCHINPNIGGVRLQELKPSDIKYLHAVLQKERTLTIGDKERRFKKLSPKSIVYVHRVLSKALEDARVDEIIPRNPAKLVSPPKVPKHRANFLTTAQIKDTLKKFEDDEMFMPVYLALVLGLRRGEALGLTWDYVDFENKVIRIQYNYTMAKGKPILLEYPKTNDSHRDIIVTDRIVQTLKQHKRKQYEARLKLGSQYHVTNYVCTWPDGTLMNPSHVSRNFDLRMKKYGLPDITYHELRHSNGSLMISNKVHMKGASERLGHSTVVVTNDYYGHVEKDVQEQIAATIDKAIWGE